MALFSKLFTGANDREVKKLNPVLDEVNDLEPEIEALSDSELQAKTDEFRGRLAEDEDLDDILPEALAVAREAIRRRLGQRAFDTQILGAVVLHQGKIAELRTGEGKTLVASLALYLNALDGRGAHLFTVNDYLSKRDAQWYGRVLAWMGISVGVVQHDASFLVSPDSVSEEHGMEYLTPCSRRDAYAADATYGTNHEFGFDYLRDNMAQDAARRGLGPRAAARGPASHLPGVRRDEGPDREQPQRGRDRGCGVGRR